MSIAVTANRPNIDKGVIGVPDPVYQSYQFLWHPGPALRVRFLFGIRKLQHGVCPEPDSGLTYF